MSAGRWPVIGAVWPNFSTQGVVATDLPARCFWLEVLAVIEVRVAVIPIVRPKSACVVLRSVKVPRH